jgi:hypothetical protein
MGLEPVPEGYEGEKNMIASQKPLVLYRVTTMFLLFLAGLFYWRCGVENGRGWNGGLLFSSQNISSRVPMPVNNEFSKPVRVAIRGYAGHAMEPFVSHDGNYLFFNGLNDGRNTCLYYAVKFDDETFIFMGKIFGVNGTPPHSDAVPSMDDDGRFYFVSSRGAGGRMNVCSGNFLDGAVLDLDAQPGNFYGNSSEWIIRDVSISPDGGTLYYVRAHLSGGGVPDRADIGAAQFSMGDFNTDANSGILLKNINTDDCLEYAPSISRDGLELFFTRLDPMSRTPRVMMARRYSRSEPFGTPELIGALDGYAEGASITADKKTLYYHRRDRGTFAIYKVSR